jgi:succinoglycan biosynthesis protein ExoO
MMQAKSPEGIWLEAPSVAVVIAAYNVAGYVERAIASAQAQTLAPAEILVADDNSIDGTAEIVRGLAERDPRIRLLRSDKNDGPGAARNRAIEAARSDWIAILDADDAWKPQRLERLTEAARTSDSVLVADNYIRLDDTTGLELGTAFADDRPVSALTVARFIQSEHPLGRFRFGLLKPVVRRDFLQEHAIRYPTDIRLAEDFHFFLRVLLEGGKGLLLSDPFYIYTLPQSLVSGSQSKGSRTRPDLNDRVWIADDLIERYAGRAPPETIHLLRRYRGWMSDIANGRRALEAWRRGARLRALGLTLSRPRAAFSYAWTSPTMKRIRAGFEFRQARPPG